MEGSCCSILTQTIHLCLRQSSRSAARQMSASATVMENPSWQIWATPVSRTALPRDSQRRSPEISSNPNLCNLSPSPRIVSWTMSPSMPCSVRLPLQWNNTTEEVVKLRGAVTARGDLTQISFSCMRDHCRHIWHQQIITRQDAAWFLASFFSYGYCYINFKNTGQSGHYNGYFPVLSQLSAVSMFEENFVLVVNHVSLWFLRDPTPGSAGVFTCCHCIVLVTLTGPECKGIRDWFALPLSGHGAIHSLGSVQSAERMQSDPHLLDFQTQ